MQIYILKILSGETTHSELQQHPNKKERMATGLGNVFEYIKMQGLFC